MTIPQLKSVAGNVVVILLGVPMAALTHLYVIGELRTWDMIPDALDHAFFTAIMVAMGWILMKSPFAARFTELQVTQTSTKGGVTTELKTTAAVTEPPSEKKP